MNLRQRTESYWSVWIYNPRLGEGHWEPYDEGMTTRKRAESEKRRLAKRYPEERFDIVKTTNVRATPKRSTER